MDDETKKEASEKSECVIPTHPVPPCELGRYSVDTDPHSKRDIANYVEIEAPDETVQHVEKIKQRSSLRIHTIYGR